MNRSRPGSFRSIGGFVVARETFPAIYDGEHLLVKEGERFAADHQVVRDYPECFRTDPAPANRSRRRPGGTVQVVPRRPRRSVPAARRAPSAPVSSEAVPHLEFTGPARRELDRELAEWSGLEVAGGLYGTDHGVTIVARLVGGMRGNVDYDCSTERVTPSFDSWLDLERSLSDVNWRLLGSWHTHTRGAAVEPSDTDKVTWESQRVALDLDRFVGVILGPYPDPGPYGNGGFGPPIVRAWVVEAAGVRPMTLTY